jgi:hypothetical protein
MSHRTACIQLQLWVDFGRSPRNLYLSPLLSRRNRLKADLIKASSEDSNRPNPVHNSFSVEHQQHGEALRTT